MFTVSQANTNSLWSEPLGQHKWWLAVASPLLLAPIWLVISEASAGQQLTLSGLLLTLLLVVATGTDLTRRKIYNWTTYTALAWAFSINVAASHPAIGSIGWTSSILGAAICFGVMLIPYSLARGGAGDVKLAAAIGALVGVDSGLLIIAFTYIIAGVAILGYTILTRGPWALAKATLQQWGAHWFPQSYVAPDAQQREMLQHPVPLAGFFALATIAVVFDPSALDRGLGMVSLRTGSRRLGSASMELVLATAVTLPIAGAVLFLGFKICSYVYSALGGLLTMPFLWVTPWAI